MGTGDSRRVENRGNRTPKTSIWHLSGCGSNEHLATRRGSKQDSWEEGRRVRGSQNGALQFWREEVTGIREITRLLLLLSPSVWQLQGDRGLDVWLWRCSEGKPVVWRSGYWYSLSLCLYLAFYPYIILYLTSFYYVLSFIRYSISYTYWGILGTLFFILFSLLYHPLFYRYIYLFIFRWCRLLKI